MKAVQRSWYKKQVLPGVWPKKKKEHNSCPGLNFVTAAAKPLGKSVRMMGKRRRHPLFSKINFFLFLAPVLRLES